MADKVVLISEDSDFFEFIRPKLELRKSDELLMFNFDAVPERISFLEDAVLIVNSENNREKTLDLLNLFKTTPVIVFSYNDDDVFRRKCYRAGAFDFKTILTDDSDFRASMLPLLKTLSILKKNKYYRSILESKKIIKTGDEIYLDYESILEIELEKIRMKQRKAVFIAIAPSEKTKFLLKPSIIESILSNQIRKNDLIMNYAPNKYYLLIYDTDLNSAQKLWKKILKQLPEKMYAGFVNIFNQNKQQLINEALNRLHTAINNDLGLYSETKNTSKNLPFDNKMNFKEYKQEYFKNFEKIVSPVFYQISQKYSDRLMNVKIEHFVSDGMANFTIIGNVFTSKLIITSPGLSKINIDIILENKIKIVDSKRISIEQNELEQGLLDDLLEQFILEYKKGCENDN